MPFNITMDVDHKNELTCLHQIVLLYLYRGVNTHMCNVECFTVKLYDFVVS